MTGTTGRRRRPIRQCEVSRFLAAIPLVSAGNGAYSRGMATNGIGRGASLRVGQAAEMLQVSVDTLRRWETEGRLRMERSEGGQRLVAIDEVARLLEERRRASTDRPIVAQSARNRFAGIVIRVEKDRVAAVEIGRASCRERVYDDV